jgi:type IV pilus assembly protein PilC
MIVIIFAFLVLIVMLVFVVPLFQTVLMQLNIDLPFLTKVVLGLSEMLRSPVFILSTPLIIAFSISFYRVFKHDPKFAQSIDYYKLKIPYVGNILYSIALGRFVRSLSILVGAGLPIVESFEVAKTTTSNQYVVGGVNQAQRKIERGQSLYESFNETKLFPVMFVEMVGVGESSGAIVQSLENLADHFDEEVEYKQNKFFTLLEPFLIIFVGIIVIIILLAIYMPIFSIWSGLLG